MDISMVTVTIYFVGIAAFVNAPPQNSVAKSVIFPAAQAGTYVTTAGETLNLMPHHTYLYIRDKDMAADPAPQKMCDLARGEWIAGSPNSLCKIALNGAKVWTITAPSDTVTEDQYYRKMPSFSQYCPYAKDLPAVYTAGDLDPQYVAARFDIKGGTMSGCNRAKGAFVTRLTTISPDSVLYIQQNERTSRIFLNEAFKIASFTIANSPDSSAMAMEMDSTIQYANDYRGHFGWYYRMNGRATQLCDIVDPAPAAVGTCPSIPGEELGTLAASADCSNSNFP